MAALPFELQVLEVALRDVSELATRLSKELEAIAHPALDTLTKQALPHSFFLFCPHPPYYWYCWSRAYRGTCQDTCNVRNGRGYRGHVLGCVAALGLRDARAGIWEWCGDF